MKARRKEFPLSHEGITKAINYLEEYKKAVLERTLRLLEELKNIGIEEADKRFYLADGNGTDTTHTYVSAVTFDGENVVLTLAVNGEDLVFIEFGAGVYYNPDSLGKSAHASPTFRRAFPEFRIGKYGVDGDDEWSQGAQEEWYYNGEWVRGTKATMPVYGAELAIMNSVREAAKKAFADLE